MKVLFKLIWGFSFLLLSLSSCNPDENDNEYVPSGNPHYFPIAYLNYVLKFDSTQSRLDKYGNVSNLPLGHGAQSPVINSLRIGFVEFLEDSAVPYDSGYRGLIFPQILNNNDTGFKCCNPDFAEGQIFSIMVGDDGLYKSFRYIRIYLVYENLRIKYSFNNTIFDGNVAAFLGHKALTQQFHIQDSSYNS